MDRRSANALRILGIVLTVIVVLALILPLLYLGFFVVLFGGVSEMGRIRSSRATDLVSGAILLVVAIVTGGVIIIGRLATGIEKAPAGTGDSRLKPDPRTMWGQPPSAVQRSEAPQPVPLSMDLPSSPQLARGLAAAPSAAIPAPTPSTAPLHLSPLTRKTIDRLALAIVAQTAVSTITWFQIAARYTPRTLILLPSFILSEAPDVLLIYLLLKRPSRRSFTFLIAMLIFPILETLFNPLVLSSYRRIYTNSSMGSLWLALAGMIYIVTVVLAYKAIHQTGFKPQPSRLILATVAVFFYFFFVREVTPYLYSLWR
jgi:hypothetical protein